MLTDLAIVETPLWPFTVFNILVISITAESTVSVFKGHFYVAANNRYFFSSNPVFTQPPTVSHT